MSVVSLAQPTAFDPDKEGGFWNVVNKTTTWSTVSIDAHTWTVSLPGSQTLVFTSSAGFSTPRFPSDIPTGVVDTITLSNPAGLVASVTGIGELGFDVPHLDLNSSQLIRNADTISGSSGADTISGGERNDQIDGGGGADSLDGELGDDNISGGDGNDTIIDFQGTGLITGGNGDDNLRAFGAEIHGDAGNDTIDVSGGVASGGDGNDTISTSSIFTVQINGDAGDDMITVAYVGAASTVDGGAGNDTVVADYRGGPLTATQVGNITLVNVEHVIISDSLGNVDASSMPGGVNVLGGGVANQITGSAFADTIAGNGGGDTIAGGAGDDLLDGGNVFFGWQETHPTGIATVYVFTPAAYDIVDYSAATSGVVVDLNVVQQATSLGADRLTNFEGVIGSQFGDTLVASLGQLETQKRGDTTIAYSGGRLYGLGGNDLLVGSAAGDTLSGGTGADTLTGGAGADSFVLTPDGATDRITDFSATQGDTLSLANASGTVVDGSHGIAIYNQATRLLSWDADSDAGSQAPVAVATLDGGEALTKASFTGGFQPSALRILLANGAETEQVFDVGNTQTFDSTIATYDAGGKIANYSVTYDSHASSSIWFDTGNTQEWTSRAAEYDQNGALSVYSVTNDDGSTTTRFFDTLNTQPYSMRFAQYDARGQVQIYAVYADDGSHVIFQSDTNNSQPYLRTTEEWTTKGLLGVSTVVADNGVTTVTTYDTDNTKPWISTVDTYDAAGRLTAHHLNNDDGSFV